jgi:hypothetical protein
MTKVYKKIYFGGKLYHHLKGNFGDCKGHVLCTGRTIYVHMPELQLSKELVNFSLGKELYMCVFVFQDEDAKAQVVFLLRIGSVCLLPASQLQAPPPHAYTE